MLTLFICGLAPSQRWPSTSVFSLDVLRPLRQWLNPVEIRNPTQAHLFGRHIPVQRPWEPKVRVGRWLCFNVPPRGQFNPLYGACIAFAIPRLSS